MNRIKQILAATAVLAAFGLAGHWDAQARPTQPHGYTHTSGHLHCHGSIHHPYGYEAAGGHLHRHRF